VLTRRDCEGIEKEREMRSYMAQSHFVLEVGFSLSLCVCVFFGGFFALPLGWEKQDPFGLISD